MEQEQAWSYNKMTTLYENYWTKQVAKFGTVSKFMKDSENAQLQKGRQL